jgi:tetratricopeptide (TPR) repeat protein
VCWWVEPLGNRQRGPMARGRLSIAPSFDNDEDFRDAAIELLTGQQYAAAQKMAEAYWEVTASQIAKVILAYVELYAKRYTEAIQIAQTIDDPIYLPNANLLLLDCYCRTGNGVRAHDLHKELLKSSLPLHILHADLRLAIWEQRWEYAKLVAWMVIDCQPKPAFLAQVGWLAICEQDEALLEAVAKLTPKRHEVLQLECARLMDALNRKDMTVAKEVARIVECWPTKDKIGMDKFVLGYFYYAMRGWRKSALCFEAAYELIGNGNYQAPAMAGVCYFKLLRWRKAKKWADIALARVPYGIEAYRVSVFIALCWGRYGEACARNRACRQALEARNMGA